MDKPKKFTCKNTAAHLLNLTQKSIVAGKFSAGEVSAGGVFRFVFFSIIIVTVF